jgi:general secretion pathway protein G
VVPARPAEEREGGFTLVELLVVIVVLGVLAGLVVLAVGGIRDRGVASACEGDRRTLDGAIGAYHARTGSYPPSLTALSDEQYVRPDPGLSATQKSASEYTLTYSPVDGTVSDCQTSLAVGGGGSPGGGTPPADEDPPPPGEDPPPISSPSISNVSPNPFSAGNSARTVTVNGAGFVSGAAVVFTPTLSASGVSFVSSGQLTVDVTAPNSQKGSHAYPLRSAG